MDSSDAERGFIGSLIGADSATLDKYLDVLDLAAFSLPGTREAYRLMCSGTKNDIFSLAAATDSRLDPDTTAKWALGSATPEYYLPTIRHAYAARSALRASEAAVEAIRAGDLAQAFDIWTEASTAASAILSLDGQAAMSNIAEVTVDWLWDQRIPIGMLTLIAGDPKCGKSYLGVALCAGVSIGAKIVGQSAPLLCGEAAIVAAEDHLAAVVKKRLRLCGADDSKIFALPPGISQLESLARSHPDLRLVVIDSLMRQIGARINTSAANEVTAVLRPYADFAERHNIAVCALMHLTKAQTENIMYRLSGSVAFAGSARSIIYVTRDPETRRRSVDVIAGNLGEEPDPVEFRIEGDGFFWIGEAPELTAEAALGPKIGRPPVKSQTAHGFLMACLTHPRPSAEVVEVGAKEGHSERTLRRVAAENAISMWVKTPGARGSGVTWWALPDQADQLRSIAEGQDEIEF